ncbi:MAG: selenocysteine-specific translation elongation factor [Caldisericia bacterium]|nr:selenocysteine-specific translation elongation factor [Caldisericia bacterium]
MEARSFIVGTAGHVDHGKSTLVTKISGIDPDRLPEEKERQMTIELGFAPLKLPSGRKCGIVDVPGHEKLVRQMLMGAQGFDLVMFTVACDEGPKVQTEEHLAILNQLNLKLGIVVLTKCDLPHDDAELQVKVDRLVANSFLENAPRIKVSAYTGEGIDILLAKIDEMLNHSEPRSLNMPAFYPIDRAFAVKGFGIVTTGTLWQGKINKNSDLEIFPTRKLGRVRRIELFDSETDQGLAGSRLAINFPNLEKDDLEHGYIAATPKRFEAVEVIDAKVQLIKSIKRKTRLKFHYATIVQEVDYIDHGEGFARIHLESPLPMTKGARFILRSIAPADTVGGGNVLDMEPTQKIQHLETIDRLKRIDSGIDEDYLLLRIDESGAQGFDLAKLRVLVNWPDDRFDEFLKNPSLVRHGQKAISKNVIAKTTEKLSKGLLDFFKTNPDRTTLPKSEARSKLAPEMPEDLFSLIIDNAIAEPLRKSGNDIVSGATNQKSPIEVAVIGIFKSDIFQPPSLTEIKQNPRFASNRRELESIISKLIAEKQILRGDVDLYFHKDAVDKAFEIVRKYIKSEGSIKLAQFRDEVKTSRKFAQAMLEMLDMLGLTRRNGEVRQLGPKGIDK